MGVSHVSKVTGNSCHKRRLLQDTPEEVQVGYQKNFFTKWVFKHWNGLSREVVESSSLEVFKKQLELALSSMV